MNAIRNSARTKAAWSRFFPGWHQQTRHGSLQCARKVGLAATIAGTALCIPLPSFAAGTGDLLYKGMTLPSGLVKIANDYWVSDHLLGFCRLVPGTPGTPGGIDQGSCTTAQVSPGQAAAKEGLSNPNDPNSKVTYAYVPDNSSKGRGVWRHTIKDGYVQDSIMLNNTGIDGNRPMAVALGLDGNLYVSLGRNNNIMRIRNPDPSGDFTRPQPDKIGTSAVKVGPPALAFVGNTLYLAENTGLTAIVPASGTDTLACTGACTAKAVNSGVGAPVFVTSDADALYIADLGNAYRYTPPASGIPGCLKLLGSGYGGIASLTASSGTDTVPASLHVGDDPTAGASIFTGVVYRINPNSTADCAVTSGPIGGGGGTAAAPPVATAPATLTGPTPAATLPAAIVQVGTETWISDHVQGFCRLGANGPERCVANAALAPGQAVAVSSVLNGAPVTYIYVPDTASKGLGVWRLTHDGTGISSATLLAPGKLSGARTSSVAYGPDKNLYVANGKDNRVLRIANPEGSPVDVEQIGFVSGRAGPPAMTFSGGNLYLAEATGITMIQSAANCNKSALCSARAVSTPVSAPVFVAADDTYLYVADLTRAYRLAFSGTSPSIKTDLGTGFSTISAIGFNIQPAAPGSTSPVRSLFVGDDTTAGTSIGTGRIWRLNISPLWP
jgi:hypothetical protein